MWGLMFKKFRQAESGNVAMMFSLTLGVIGIGLGVAIDGNKMVSVHSRASAVADAAALAGASASEASASDREAIVRAYIEANAFKISPGLLAGAPVVVFDDESETVSVTIPTDLKLTFGGFLGSASKNVGATSTAVYMRNNIDPVTIAFALDVSGSMQWDTSDGASKIEVLKKATKSLFDSIESGTDNPSGLKKALRSGMSAYNTKLTSSQPMNWGWDNLERSVSALAAGGGTNSTPALENSYNQLVNDRAYRRSYDANYEPERLKEYVIFMTDGDNNLPEFDLKSAEICQNMRSEGIEIYSVAFEASEKGQLLLVDCASPNLAEGSSNGSDKCMNNGKKGKGKALGHCNEDAKSEYYFDAKNAAAFEAAFQEIGKKIVHSNVRLN